MIYKKYKHSKPQKWGDFYDKMLTHIELGEEFIWPKPNERSTISQTLSEFLSDESISHIFDGADGWERMDRLRCTLKVELLRSDLARATAICIWIVRTWGGINTGLNEIPAWVNEWQGFDRGKVHDFVNRKQYARIASWSKILSFAFPEQYAVYDARNAAALDCAFEKIGLGRRFPITATQNTHVNRVRKYLVSHRYVPVDLTYHDYLVLLHSYASKNFGGNIMRAEMNLFANSVEVITRYLNEQNAVI